MERAKRKREDRELVERLNRDALSIARRFGLRFRSIEAERANVKRRYGVCYADGTIRIRLRHAKSGEPLKYSSLVNTLCHELAHLRHFNHGRRFQALYRQILEHARRAGIYRPGADEVPVEARPRWAAPAARSPATRATRTGGVPIASPAAARAEPQQLALF